MCVRAVMAMARTVKVSTLIAEWRPVERLEICWSMNELLPSEGFLAQTARRAMAKNRQ